MTLSVEGFEVCRVGDSRRDLWGLIRAGDAGAADDSLGRYDSEQRAWQRARVLRDKERASVMVPGSRGSSARLVRP